MMVEPTVTDLLKKINNRFELVVVTSKRARQLSRRRCTTNKKA